MKGEDRYWDCLDQAMEASHGGRTDEALAWLDEALAAHPEGAEAHNGRGEILWDEGRVDEALHEFERSIGADPKSSSRYARSKAEGEAAVLEEFPDAVILRPSIVFGPEDQFFNRFAAMARISPFLPLIGGGKTRFQPVFVGDIGAAVAACLAGAGKPGTVYELGGPEVLKAQEIASPTPGPGQILVRVKACGVNFADSLVLKGKYQVQPELPFSPGAEVAGTVVLDARDGSVVFAHRQKGFADHPDLDAMLAACEAALGSAPAAPAGEAACGGGGGGDDVAASAASSAAASS